MSITSRITIAGATALIAAVAMTGCVGPGSTAPASERPTSKASSATPTPTPTAEAAMPTDLTFEDGAALSTTKLPAFSLEVSALADWKQTGEDPATGTREYTNSDGSVATIVQQRITDLDPSIGDRAATEQLFTAAGLPAEQLEEQLLPTMTDGTVQFLSIAGHNSDGSWSATVARAFAKPGAALIVKVKTSSQESLRPDLHDILVHAQVVIV